MASPSLSATLTFVKKYPITLCGFSLFFMPSVHRLLLYFTPLLLSTAIFIVAMMTWGPRVSSEKSATHRRAGRGGAKHKLMAEHNEWAFHESMGMDDEEEAVEEEEEEEEEEGDQTEEVDTTKLSHHGKASQTLHTQETTQKGEVEPASGLESRVELEPADPDLMETVASGANSAQADEPDPDLQGVAGVGTAANDDMDLHEEPCVHDGCPHVDDVHATHKSNMPIRGDGNDGGDIGPHAGPHEMGLETHDMMGLDAHANMVHVHDCDAGDHTSHDMVDTHAHQQQHQHQPHAYDHVQEEVHTGVEQTSYILERLVQVSAA